MYMYVYMVTGSFYVLPGLYINPQSTYQLDVTYRMNLPMYLESLVQFPLLWTAFRTLTSKPYVASGLRPFSLVRRTLVAGESTVNLDA